MGNDWNWLIFSTAGVAVVFWMTGRINASRYTERRCPTCRYLTRGLPSHICPECGTDLRKNPPVQQHLAYWWTLEQWVAMWSLFWALAGFGVGQWAWSLLPRWHTGVQRLYLLSTYTKGCVRLTAEGSGYRSDPTMSRLLIAVVQYPEHPGMDWEDSPARSLNLDLPHHGCRLVGVDGQVLERYPAFDRAAIRRILSESYMKLDERQLSATAAEIETIADGAASVGWLADGNFRIGGVDRRKLSALMYSGSAQCAGASDTVPLWATLPLLFAWIGIWGGGVYLIGRMKRRGARGEAFR